MRMGRGAAGFSVEAGPKAPGNLYVGVCFWPEQLPKRPAPLPPPDPLLCAPVCGPLTGSASPWGTRRGPRPAAACHRGGRLGPFRSRPDLRGCCTGYGGREAAAARTRRGGAGDLRAGRGGAGGSAGSGRALPTTRRGAGVGRGGPRES